MQEIISQIFLFLKQEAWPIILYLLIIAKTIFLSWWWLLLPFLVNKLSKIFLGKSVEDFWFFYLREKWSSSQKKVLLEIKISKVSLKPMKAMENVLNAIWLSIDEGDPNWHEKWIGGQYRNSMSLEITSFGGEPHFFIRIPAKGRDLVEAAIFAQYPDVEISVAEDYTKKVPQDIPNNDWDLWGCEFKLLEKNAFPIKTYDEFETGSESVEEKRVDPMAGLLEALGKILPGEQLWIQIVAKPLTMSAAVPFAKEGEETIAKLLHRPVAAKKRPFVKQLFEFLISGKPIGVEKLKEDESAIPAEMKLSPEERLIVLAVEEKVHSQFCECFIKFIYLGKKDVFFKPRCKIPFGYFSNFGGRINGLFPRGGTLTKASANWYDFFWFRDRRRYVLERHIFRHYCSRLRWYYPNKEIKPGVMILSTKELATLYHFPSSLVAPAPFVPRVEAKRGGAPLELPRE